MTKSIAAALRRELAELIEQRHSIDQKIEALRNTLSMYRQEADESPNAAPPGRGGVDLRPIVAAIFNANGNQPLRVREITSEIEKIAPDIPRRVIAQKMVYAVRPKAGLLRKTDYGKYQLLMEQPEMTAPLNPNEPTEA